MKILVLASTFPRWRGDPTPSFVYALSSDLADRGHEVHVLAPHAPGAAQGEELGGVKVHRFRYAPGNLESLCYGGGILENLRRQPLRWGLLPSFLTAEFNSMVSLALRYKIQIVHAHWALPQGLIAVLGRRFLRLPIVTTTHAADILVAKSGLRRWLLRIATRGADACTAVSSATRTELQRLTGKDSLVIPMGVDTSRFLPRRRDTEGPPRLLFVGRLAEKKGAQYLLHAMRFVLASFPEVRLVVVGHGPESERLMQLTRQFGLADAVEFVGAVPNESLPEYYGVADVFVLPSIVTEDGDTEGLPVVLLEAAASGVPLVATRVGGIPDVVRHEETGLLVEPANPQQLAQAIVRVLRDGELRQRLATNARRHVVENFTWDSVVARFDALLRGVVEGR